MKNSNNNTNNTNVTLNLIQSLFKFNKLGYGNTCQGLRHWRLLSNLKNNFSKPTRNDMDNNKSRSALPIQQLNRLDCFASARNDVSHHTEGDSPKYLSTLGSRFFALHARIKRIRLTPSSSAHVAQNDVINKNIKNLSLSALVFLL